MIVDVQLGEPRTRGPLTVHPLIASGAKAPAYLPGPWAAAQGAITVTELDGAALSNPSSKCSSPGACRCYCSRARPSSAPSRTAP